jgi:hypothetical protein
MATISVHRVIAANPTSAALLLAGPTALDLWPGVTRVGGVAGRVLVAADVPALAARRARVLVRALPPRRQPTAYVTRFDLGGGPLPDTEGTLTLAYGTCDAVPVATDATLTLSWPALERGTAEHARVTAAFRAMAEEFLANLATAAEQRAHAA